MKNETLDELTKLIDELCDALPPLYLGSDDGFATQLDGRIASIDPSTMIRIWGSASVTARELRLLVAAIPRRKTPTKAIPNVRPWLNSPIEAPSDTEIKEQ